LSRACERRYRRGGSLLALGTVLTGMLLSGLPAALALDPDRRISQYGHSVWRIQDGAIAPPTNIAQTTDGFLWITTAQGLMRFDGVRFTPWQPPQGQNLPGTHFSAVFGSRDGSLWIGTTRGLARWKDGQLRTYTDLEHPVGIGEIIEDDSETIWATRYGPYAREAPLCSISEQRLRCFGKKDGIPVGYGLELTHDSEGNIWFGSSVLVRWRPGSPATTYFGETAELAKSDGVVEVALGPSGTAWASLDGTGPQLGVRYYSGGKWTSYAVPGFDGTRVRSQALLVDRRGSLWVGTQNDGVYRICGGVADHYGVSDGLSGNGVGSLFEDREGNIWVTTDGGLDMFRDTALISYTTRQGVSDRQFHSLVALRNGEEWIGTGGALNILRKQDGKTGIFDRKLSGQAVGPMLEDHGGVVWLGVDLILMRFQNGRFREIGGQRFAGIGGVNAIAEDSGGTIWILANRNQLFSIVGDKIKKQASLNDELGWQKYLVADPNGGVWLGTQKGKSTVSYFRDGRLQTTSLSSPQGPAGIQALFVDSDNSLLVASSQGLYRINHGQVTLFSSDNGLPCPETFSAIRDSHGALWIYTRCGLVRIAQPEWAKWIENPHVAVSVMTLDALDGAQAGTGDFWQPTSSKAPDGHLWFVTGASVQMLEPDRLYENALPPPVYVEGVVADRKRFDATSLVKVPALSRDLEIDYTAPSFSVPQKVRFRYMLEGRDREWQDAGTRRQAFYTDLKPGHYRFRVTACNSAGVWNQTGASLAFTIPPAFTQGTWFKAICVLGFVGLVYSAYRFRVRQVTGRLRENEQRYRQIINNIPGFVCTMTARGEVEFVNQRISDYTGWTLEELRDWAPLVHNDDLPQVLRSWEHSVSTGNPYDTEHRIRGTDGLYRWFYVRGYPHRDSEGRIIRWYGLLTDIEEKKVANEKLRRSEAYLTEAQGLSHTGSFGWNVVTGRIFWSEETYRIVDCIPGTRPTLQFIFDRIHPEDRERVQEILDRATAGDEDLDFEHRFLFANGSLKYVHVVAHPAKDELGNLEYIGAVTDITDRKRAEEALQLMSRDLQESKIRLEEAQRIAHVGHWVWDQGKDGLTWSDETYRIFGLGPQERPMNVEAFQEMIHPEDREFLLRATQEARDGGRPDIEFRIVRPSGEVRIVHSQGAVTKDVPGQPRQRFGAIQDITDRKRVEEALQQTQFYLVEGQRLAHMGSWALNPSGFFDYWSQELFEIYGLDPQKGSPTLAEYLATVHPQDRDFMVSTIKRMHAECSGCDVKKRIVRPDGELRYIRCVGIPVVEGEVLKGFLGTAMDITEQELLTQEIERQQAHLTEAQKLTHTGSWAWRLADRKMGMHLSEEWYRIYGFDPAEGAPTWEEYLERVHPEDRLKWKSITERAIVEKTDYDHEFRLLLSNGKVKWIRTVGHPVLSNAGDLEGFVGSSTDITEFKAAEQQREKLRQLEADLAHTNRVGTLGEMAASLAHEIKQPIAAAITSANSCIEWLGHEPPNLDRARAAAARIAKYGNRAAEIIDRIRSFYKKSPPQRELVDMNGIIHEILMLLEGEADRLSVAVRTDLSADLPKIMVDRVQPQQVFMNLILNGIEAMEDSGGELTVKSQLQDGQLQFSVSDTGVGLPMEKMDQIFSAFFTTKPQGSGMGLAISRSIVESHGSHLWATANVGQGSSFHFALPTRVAESALAT
jgi:PAS domain S-box-containing protein